MLEIYNKQYLLINEPRFNYIKLKQLFDNLYSDFIFPEVFDKSLNDFEFYSYIDSPRQFNNLKIKNSFFKPELLLSKIEADHLNYLNKLDNIYNNFSYNLIFISSYIKFLNKFEISKFQNYFKCFIFNEDLNSNCNKRSPILNIIFYKFIKPFIEKSLSYIKYQSSINVVNIEKKLLKITTDNKDGIVNFLTDTIITKILKLTDNFSPDYKKIIKEKIVMKLLYGIDNTESDSVKKLFNKYIDKVINPYFFIEINFKIIEYLIEHITFIILNYPKEIVYFINKDDKFKNNKFDIDKDGIIDEIWDPDDDDDFISELSDLNPKLKAYYEKVKTIEDNKTKDCGDYISHMNILEKQIFNFIKNIIKSRESETSSLFYAAAQFSESEDSTQYLNSLLTIVSDYLSDMINTPIFDDINREYLPDRVVNMFVKNIYISTENDGVFNSFFKNLNFSKVLKSSKAIELSILNRTTRLIFDFFDSEEFKKFLFEDFFIHDYLPIIENVCPNSRDGLIQNLDNLITSLKFIFTNEVYNKNMFEKISDEYFKIYNNSDFKLQLPADDILDIYDNYQNTSQLNIDEYRTEIKKVLISSVYSAYIDLFIDSFRITKKFQNI